MNSIDPAQLLIRKSGIHGCGCYTTGPIKEGAHIVEYTGTRLSKEQADDLYSDRPDTYLFCIGEGEYVVDGDSVAAFINHCCDPNCEADELDEHIWILALRDIAADEELTYDYNLYDGDDDDEALCRCGAKGCRGTMYGEEEIERRAKEVKKTEQAPEKDGKHAPSEPAPLPIVEVGDPVLRQTARELSVEEIRSSAIQSLIEKMRETMHAAPGVGLAAPQIGQSLQLAVVEDREQYHREISEEQLVARERKPVPFQVLINPRVVWQSEETREFYEGCLSLPGYIALVRRAHAVRVESLDEKGNTKLIEAAGWHARILQHEIDHLQGNLYIDRMQTRTFGSLENFNRFWKGKPAAEGAGQSR
jgi:peptide deformylase